MKEITEFLKGEWCQRTPDESTGEKDYRDGCNDAIQSVTLYLEENNYYSKTEVLEAVEKYLQYLLDPTSDKSITGKQWFDDNL